MSSMHIIPRKLYFGVILEHFCLIFVAAECSDFIPRKETLERNQPDILNSICHATATTSPFGRDCIYKLGKPNIVKKNSQRTVHAATQKSQ